MSQRVRVPSSKVLAVNQPEDSPMWREIRYLTKHSDSGRLRYDCLRRRGVPLGGPIAAMLSSLKSITAVAHAWPQLAGARLAWKSSCGVLKIGMKRAGEGLGV